MADTFIEAPSEPAHGERNQVIAAIILGIAATLTAFAAWQAALTDGDALQGYTQSTRSLSDANAFYAQGNTQSAADQALFVEYAKANFADDADLADYLTTLMRPELQEAVEWWEETDDAITPFDDAESGDVTPYTIEDFDEAAALEKEAKAQFKEGADADAQGDDFEAAAVLLALTLFFAGIATLFSKRIATTGLLVVSVVTLVVGCGFLVLAL